MSHWLFSPSLVCETMVHSQCVLLSTQCYWHWNLLAKWNEWLINKGLGLFSEGVSNVSNAEEFGMRKDCVMLVPDISRILRSYQGNRVPYYFDNKTLENIMFIFGEWAGSWPGVPDPAHYRTDSLSSEASAAHWSKEKGITKARRSCGQERAGGPKTANKEDGFPKSVSPGPRVTPDPLLSQEEKWSAHDPDLSDKMARGNIYTHTHTLQTLHRHI